MSHITNINMDHNRPAKLAEGVYWVGLYDPQTGTQANPYLIVDGNEGIIIDSGSRSIFPTVMMKILQTGIAPSSIVGLVYQNYDPRCCGSVPHLESIIGRLDLKIISDETNYLFIQHYSESAMFFSIGDLGHEFEFSSGRRLQFINTPYAHSAGSFVTFDPASGILFTSDLFSSYTPNWELLMNLRPECWKCRPDEHPGTCPNGRHACALKEILTYHQEIMPSERALRLAIERIAKLPFTMIAPQQGSIIHNPSDIIHVCKLLSSLRQVGIDKIIGDRPFSMLGDISSIRERMEAK